MVFRNYGFNLIELLTAIGISAILMTVAVRTYQKYRETPIKAAMKTEAAELSKFLNYAHSVDGGYHHNIFTIGYKPNKHLMADTGFEHNRGTAPACTSFPRNSTGDFSSFLTINKKSYSASLIESATRSIHICAGGFCTMGETAIQDTNPLSAQTFTSGHAGCKAKFSGKDFKCGCDDFRIYSRAKYPSGVEAKVLANEEGVFAYSDSDNEIDLY